jgi:Flp pilus assembly protein TadG
MPAAVLVFIVLGSLAVDSSLAFLGEREVANLASAVANDASTEGIDITRYYATGELVIDPVRVQAVADAALATSGLDHLSGLTIDTEVVGTDHVVVHVHARVRSLFSRALPSGLDERSVGASAEATAERR